MYKRALMAAPVLLAAGAALTGCKIEPIRSASFDTKSVKGVCDYAPASKPPKSYLKVVGGEKLNSTQVGHAKTIVAVGAKKHMPRRAVEVAITAVSQESMFDNGTVGDHGTAFGLFQMRPMYGWGSYSKVTDPVYAAGKFYNVLKGVDGWRYKSLSGAAQAVEKSGDGSNYVKHEKYAQRIVDYVAYSLCHG